MATQFFRCPACNSQMDVSATSCPICMRPRSRHEMIRDLQGVKKAEKKKRRLLWYSVAAVAVAAAFGLHPEWLSLIRSRVAPAVAPVAEKAKATVTETVKNNWPETVKDGAVPVTPQSSFDKAANPEAAPPKTAPAPAPAPMPTPVATNAPPADAEPAPPTRWKVEGSIYTLLDLKPAAGVDVLFAPTNGDPPRKARAGADGKYRASLPALASGGGYRISIVRRGRALPYLEEAAFAYKDRSKTQREDAVEEATQAPVLHAPLSPESADTRQDFALLPAR